MLGVLWFVPILSCMVVLLFYPWHISLHALVLSCNGSIGQALSNVQMLSLEGGIDNQSLL